jgi:predicted regulator of Ras-like GTPase activity (Roadblock/LC7/MglB family)
MNIQPQASKRARQPVIMLDDAQDIQTVLDRLVLESRGRAVFLVHRDGQMLASGGDPGVVDPSSLGALVAGNIAATGAIAGLLDELSFPNQFLEGNGASVYCHLVNPQLILVVIIDARSGLGLVRLRAKRASDELNRVFERALERAPSVETRGALLDIDDDELEGLFPD